MFRIDPASRFALRLRRWRSRLGIAAPRVAVRTEHPLHWRAVAVVVLTGLALAMAGWIYNAGLRFAGFHSEDSEQELAELRAQVQQLSRDLEQATSVASSSDSRLRIESTAHERLAAQIKALEAENSRLKADLAMFENLAGSDSGAPGLEISRVQVFREGPAGEYRFRLLIAQRGGEKEFRGVLRLTVLAMRNNQSVLIEIPERNDENSAQYAVVVRRFGRHEGVFKLDPGLQVRRVDARLLEGGVVKASGSAAL